MKPRVGFLGVGWIGRHRMQAMLDTGKVDAAAVCDPSPTCQAEAIKIAAAARPVPSLEAMLELGIDGVAIATPSALHARQAIRVFDAGKAVFCRKPLGRTAREVNAVSMQAVPPIGCWVSIFHTATQRACNGSPSWCAPAPLAACSPST